MKNRRLIARMPGRRSRLHRRVRDLLATGFGGFTILEETPVNCYVSGRHTTLHVDLLVRELGICVECHGIQHYQYTPHFHRSPDDLREQRKRDVEKAVAIREAGMTYVVVRHDEERTLTVRQLIDRINAAMQETE